MRVLIMKRLFQATYDAFRTLLKGSSSGKFGIIYCIESLQSQIQMNYIIRVKQKTLNKNSNVEIGYRSSSLLIKIYKQP